MMSSFLYAQQLFSLETLGLSCCLLLLVAMVVILILSFIFKVAIEFLPATVLAIAVYLYTGDLVLSLITFGVVALIMVVVKGVRDRD